MNYLIRNEMDSDVGAIAEVTRRAFENHPYSRQTEQAIIRALRTAGMLTISLVAELEGKVIGHIAFSPVAITDGGEGWYGMGPLSVAPELQRKGIGSALVQAGLSLLKSINANGCALVGNPEFYTRFGFTNIHGLVHEGIPPQFFLVLPLGGDVPSGTVYFHDGFHATDSTVESRSMVKISAGLLMWRNAAGVPEVLLGHPGGPFWKNKDAGVWSIPKGELSENEDHLAAAQREFQEETGIVPQGPFVPLGTVKLKSGKIVHAWAFEADCDPNTIKSNCCTVEWPPKSGKLIEIPELDKAAFWRLEEARIKINPAQVELLNRFEQHFRSR